MNGRHAGTTPWFLWPVVALWGFVAAIVIITGRILGVLLGLGLMALGIAFSITLVGLPIGIPFAILGLLLMIRSVF